MLTVRCAVGVAAAMAAGVVGLSGQGARATAVVFEGARIIDGQRRRAHRERRAAGPGRPHHGGRAREVR